MSLTNQYPNLLKPTIIQPLKTKEPLVSPPGFGEENGSKKPLITQKKSNLEELKNKKAWEVAIGPAKSIPMNLIMSYMTGNSLQMIPIMMTLMLFIGPLKAIFTDTNRSFKGLETENNSLVILQAKGVFVLCQIACMSVGIWKLNNMGLIPNSEADWLSFKVPDVVTDNVRLL